MVGLTALVSIGVGAASAVTDGVIAVAVVVAAAAAAATACCVPLGTASADFAALVSVVSMGVAPSSPALGFSVSMGVSSSFLSSAASLVAAVRKHNTMLQILSKTLYTQTMYNPKEITFYKQHAQASRVCLLGGVNHAQHRMNKPLSIWQLLPRRSCTNHGPVRDVLA